MDDLGKLSRAAEGIELIQQWQYVGEVHPKLLEDEAFEYCKKVGVTSVQSYVYWAEVEKRPGKIDSSTYDILVEKLRRHSLKWVPFIILGPCYATPKWFRESNESVYAKCLEHERETRIQSIWNPNLPKYVDRFLKLLAEHYQDHDLLESIALGISGNWGESIYPANGGFLQRKLGFHTHPGWWCGDKYAVVSFQQFATGKYKSLQALNAAWGTDFHDFTEINFPPIKQPRWLELIHHIFSKMPNWTKAWLKIVQKRLSTIQHKNGFLAWRTNSRPLKVKKPAEQQRWLDFIDWYLSSMTDWGEFWVKTARKYFPDTEIYLVTGGYGQPILGADFSSQTKIVARYNAGIRITNQNDDYSQSFVFTRLVSSASRFYNAYFTTEEGGVNQPKGVTMRVFDAVTSGAKGAYFKSIIGTGTDICIGDTFTIGEPTQGAVNLAQNLRYLTLSKPIVDVAVLFPNTSIVFDPAILTSVYNQCSELRDVLDLDLVDENMIEDDALGEYRFVLLLDGNLVRDETLIKIERWIKAGGILICAKHIRLSTISGDTRLYEQLYPQFNGVEKIGEGYTLLYHGRERDYLEFIKQAIHDQGKSYPWVGIPEIDSEWDKVYATQFANRITYYNSTSSKIRKKVNAGSLSQKLEFEIDIEANSIVSIPYKTD